MKKNPKPAVPKVITKTMMQQLTRMAISRLKDYEAEWIDKMSGQRVHLVLTVTHQSQDILHEIVDSDL